MIADDLIFTLLLSFPDNNIYTFFFPAQFADAKLRMAKNGWYTH